jgi:hypothetical protein
MCIELVSTALVSSTSRFNNVVRSAQYACICRQPGIIRMLLRCLLLYAYQIETGNIVCC